MSQLRAKIGTCTESLLGKVQFYETITIIKVRSSRISP